MGLEGPLPLSWDCVDPDRCGLAALQMLWLVGAVAGRAGQQGPGGRQHAGRQGKPCAASTGGCWINCPLLGRTVARTQHVCMCLGAAAGWEQPVWAPARGMELNEKPADRVCAARQPSALRRQQRYAFQVGTQAWLGVALPRPARRCLRCQPAPAASAALPHPVYLLPALLTQLETRLTFTAGCAMPARAWSAAHPSSCPPAAACLPSCCRLGPSPCLPPSSAPAARAAARSWLPLRAHHRQQQAATAAGAAATPAPLWGAWWEAWRR